MQPPADWANNIDVVLQAGLHGSTLAPVLGASDLERRSYAQTFADDFGHRRAVDAPLLSWVLKVEPWTDPVQGRVDAALWAALRTGDDPLSLIDTDDGAVAPGARAGGIEVWTEIELASLQALWWHARRSPEVRGRALSQARWLMAELQPDNGTNRPWALATFAELATAGDTDAGLYADTLLHNCQVSMGRPDLLSTVILLDASASLRERRG